MHQTAMLHAKLFFDAYVLPGASIVDIGSQDVNGSLRSLVPGHPYTGVDFAQGKGVDVVITDPYQLPFEDEQFDVCVSSSCFEHSEFFWLSFLEMARIVKRGGLIYLNAPSNGLFHRFPVDCWRFYPDSGIALEKWAQRNGVTIELLESFTGLQHLGVWNDFVAVFGKEFKGSARPIQDRFADYTNGFVRGREGFSNYQETPEDQRQPSFTARAVRKLRRVVGA